MSKQRRHVQMANFVAMFWLIAASVFSHEVMAAEPMKLRGGTKAGRSHLLSVVDNFSTLPSVRVTVDASDVRGPLEMWRHSIGQGGISPAPLPNRVIEGTRKLEPRLIRIFIQEFFQIYPEHGKFDWSRLDPYMTALSKTGAKVMAAITIKPKPLFPLVDENIWRPNDVAEWQRVIAALVRRYSVEQPIVTYWEIGNEPDIGEEGGCPYLIKEPQDYAEFYRMTIEPIVATFPQAKVGGPAVADAAGHLASGFIDNCAAERTRLDFVSWHVYADDPAVHAKHLARFRKLLSEKFPEDKRPEMMVTEWNKGFEPVSVEEAAFHPRRAAAVAASILAMTEAGVDRSFYYHLWDQTWHADDFRPFFRKLDLMSFHWNQMPHRFGMFGVAQEVRPQYFVYQMMGQLGEQRVRATSDAQNVRILASRDPSGERVSLMLVNYGLPASKDCVVTIQFSGLKRGAKQLTSLRIDRSANWSIDRLELLPVEQRAVETQSEFSCQVYCPADSVSIVLLDRDQP